MENLVIDKNLRIWRNDGSGGSGSSIVVDGITITNNDDVINIRWK